MRANKVWTPKLTFQEVSEQAELLRAEYESLQQIPVDIDSFLEFDLGLQIVPLADLRKKVNAEAMISQDYTTIYVDVQSYMDEKQWTRLKFSIAHELGHLYLHKEFFAEQKVNTEEEWIQLMSSLQFKYYFLEYHANWFAGVLLVPASELKKKLLEGNCSSIASLTRHFEVSRQVIERRLSSQDMEDAIEALKNTKN